MFLTKSTKEAFFHVSRQRIHDDVVNLQIEILRQLQIQKVSNVLFAAFQFGMTG